MENRGAAPFGEMTFDRMAFKKQTRKKMFFASHICPDSLVASFDFGL